MDPIAAAKAFDLAMMTRDRAAIAESADAIVGWLRKGGFAPHYSEEPAFRRGLTHKQLEIYFADIRHVAEMV